jgi:predicted ATPase
MLERVRLTDFKSFVDEEVQLAPLTLLVGANASGKSNFLDALLFLRQTRFDMSLAEVLDGQERAGADRWTGLRGGARETARVGTSMFSVESTWNFAPTGADVETRDAETVDPVEVTHRIACRTIPEPMLEAESLGHGRAEGSVFRSGAVRSDSIEMPWPSARSETTLVSRARSVIGLILGSYSPGPLFAEAVTYADSLSSALERIEVLSVATRQMRGYGRRRARLGEDASNISGVLAQLCDDPMEKRTLIDWLVQICAPELVDLDFIEVPELGDVMAVIIEKGDRRISISSLSDGTLRFLGLLVALRTADSGSVILIEDIEADLHPTRIRLLVEYLEAVTRERNIQIIATTHSPVVLEWLSEAALRSAIVFGRVPEREGTLMRRLGDLPQFNEIVKSTGIDELFTTGWLEMAL